MKPRLLLLLGLIMVYSAGGAPVFTALPNAAETGGIVTVSFTLSEYTDVTVEVLDSAGKIIRHLCSGKLGPRAPLPFQTGSLAQTVYWDKKDDDGILFAGPYDIKVGLGLKASFDRIFGSRQSNISGYLRGAATDTAGNAYLIYGSYTGESKAFAYTRDGEYLRTLVPYPSSLPEARVKGYGRVALSDGRIVPRLYQPQYKSHVQPGIMGQQRHGPCVTSQGMLLFMNGGTALHGTQMNHRRILVMGLDASCPLDTFFGPAVSTSINDKAYYLAASPDGKTVYVTGNDAGLYRAPVNSLGMVQPFLSGAGSTMSAPHGIETDHQGRIYVCDWAANKVKIFDSTGVVIDSFNAYKPEIIKVDRHTNKMYVFSLDSALAYVKVIKYNALPARDSACSINFAWGFKTRKPIFTLDYSGARPIVWVGPLEYANDVLKGAEDAGSSFVPITQTIPNSTQRGTWACWNGAGPGYMAVDPQERTLYVGNMNHSRIDLQTGAITSSKIKGEEIGFGPDGSIYSFGAAGYTDPTFMRYDRNENRIAFPSGALTWTGPGQYCFGPDVGTKGFVVTKNHDFYIFHAGSAPRGTLSDMNSYNRVSVYDSLGRLKDSMIVRAPSASGGIQVDRTGNIYIGYNCRPKGMDYPDILRGFSMDFAGVAFSNYYLYTVGCLFKFPPSGGTILGSTVPAGSVPPGNLDGNSVPPLQVCGYNNHSFSVTGASWQYFGLSTCPTSENWGDASCICVSPRFNVDEYGRVFLTNDVGFSVVVLDSNKNEMLRFGDYGNADQTGPGSALPSPEIPLTLASYVTRINNSVYISDYGSKRVLRVKLGYKEWATTGGQSSAEFSPRAADHLALHAWPNPFNPGVYLEASAPDNTPVSVMVYAADGRLVRNLSSARAAAASHILHWDGRDYAGRAVAAGLYVARMSSGARSVEKNLMLVK